MTGAFLAGVIAGYGVAVPVGAIAVLIAGLTARTSLRVGAAAGLGAATADGVYALIAVLGGVALAAAIAPIATPLRWVAAVTLILLAAHTARVALRKPAIRRSSGPSSTEPDSVHDPSDPGSVVSDSADGSAGLGSGVPDSVQGSPGLGSGVPDSAQGSPGFGSGAPALGRGSSSGPEPAMPDGALRSSSDESSTADMADTTTPVRAYLGILGLTLLNPATIVYFAALVLGRGGTGGGVWFVVGAFLASASWQLLIAGGGALVGRLLTGERGRLITSLVSSVVIAVLAIALIA